MNQKRPESAGRFAAVSAMSLLRVGVLALTLIAGVLPMAASAAPLPFADRRVDINAREQPIASFLRDLFGQIDVPVVVSNAVAGSVNGTFAGDADNVLRNVSRAFGLVLYYDGSVMYVYAAGETVTRTLTLPNSESAAKLRRIAKEMGLLDSRNYLRSTTDGVLMATGTKRFVEQIEELYRADSQRREPSQSQATTFRVFQLRYAWAQDTTVQFGNRTLLVPGVARILRSLVSSSPWVGGNGGETVMRPTQTKLKGQGLAKQPILGFGEDGAASSNEAVADAYGTGRLRGDWALASAGAPQSDVRIQADPRVNAVIVRDYPSRMAEYEQLIKALDLEPVSIEIEATIIDVNTERATELGINWRWGTGRSSTLFGNGTASDTRLQPGGSVVGSAITPQARGGVLSAVLGDASQFIARISALQVQGAARVVSSPQVVTLSNVEALFDNSQTFYVRVAGREEVDLFNVSAGTSMRVTPHVFKDTDGTRIKMLVDLEDATISKTEQVDSIPIVQKSTVNTQALIYEGESLLIGGLTREATDDASDRIPLIGDIPVLGNLFKSTRKSTGRVERLFLISPRLNTRRIVQPPAVNPSVLTPSAPAAAPASSPAATSTVPFTDPVDRRRTGPSNSDPGSVFGYAP